MRGLVTRFVRAWRAATRSERAQGRAWYPEARRTVRQLADASGSSQAVAAGVVAALSPRLMWVVNVRAAGVVLQGGIPAGVFKTSLYKAQRIASRAARPLDVLRGPKVRAFYRAIMGDTRAAVVDVWVLRVAGWARSLTERAYAQVAGALEVAAAKLRVSVTDLQATAWVAIRGSAS